MNDVDVMIQLAWDSSKKRPRSWHIFRADTTLGLAKEWYSADVAWAAFSNQWIVVAWCMLIGTA